MSLQNLTKKKKLIVNVTQFKFNKYSQETSGWKIVMLKFLVLKGSSCTTVNYLYKVFFVRN